MRIHPLALAALLFAIGLAGCTTDDDSFPVDAPKGNPPGGGGQGRNVAPTFGSVTLSSDTVDNSGSSTLVLTMELLDTNGEQDFALAELSLDRAGGINDTIPVTLPTDVSGLTSEPVSFDGDGWKIWNSGTLLDGVITVQYRYVVPVGAATGSSTFTPTLDPVGNGAGRDPVTGSPVSFTVTTFSEVTIDGGLVLADGTADSGTTWGGWTASPGDQNVTATNYIALTNTGQDADAIITIDFAGSGFVGDSHGVEIPAGTNLEFAWDELPPGAAPQDGNFTFQPGNAEGSVTVQFSDLDNVIYLTYRILQMPEILPEDTYSTTFTATEL